MSEDHFQDPILKNNVFQFGKIFVPRINDIETSNVSSVTRSSDNAVFYHCAFPQV
jgi:hypothetical protein